MKIKDISFFDYTKLEGEEREHYDFAIKYGNMKSFDLFQIGSFLECTFGFVKEFQYILNSRDEKGNSLFTFEKYIELVIDNVTLKPQKLNFKAKIRKFIVKMLNKEAEKKTIIASMSIFDLIKSYNYAVEQLFAINNIENANLSHDPTPEEKQAGIGLFQDMGNFIQQHKLSKFFNCSFDEVENKQYNVCFVALKYDCDLAQYQREINRIRSNK